jgi:hypothetical protein
MDEQKRERRTPLDKILAKVELAAELGLFRVERFLGLRVECRVLDKSVNEDPHMVLDLVRLDGSGLVLLLNRVDAERNRVYKSARSSEQLRDERKGGTHSLSDS